MEIWSYRRSGDDGHSVARVCSSMAKEQQWSKRWKKSVNYHWIIFAFLESHDIFLELLLLMVREGKWKKLVFTVYLKQTSRLSLRWPLKWCTWGGDCFLKSRASFYLAVGVKTVLLGSKLCHALFSVFVVWALESKLFNGIFGKKCKPLLEADEIQVTFYLLHMLVKWLPKGTEKPIFKGKIWCSGLFKGKRNQNSLRGNLLWAAFYILAQTVSNGERFFPPDCLEHLLTEPEF